MTFYRKYRPQSLDDLLGQENVKLVLQKAFQNNSISHAYLFTGPRGSGKTSTARILAKMVNCTGKTKIPCNECISCLSITDGSSLDLIEIDAASNRGIDDIRELREGIKLAPSSSKMKVYIIDEVHMLTTEAFNALLKTLEEPPAHALFILATTEIHKIPQTILSRVQKLDFHQASLKDLVMALQKVVKEEGIKFTDEALNLLAKKADGSFRDALKLLDQLASTGSEITPSLINESFNSTSFEAVTELIGLIAKKDSPTALKFIDKLVQGGANIKDFTNSLIENMRLILLIKNSAENVAKDNLSSNQFPVILELAHQFETNHLLRALQLVTGSLQTLKFTPIPSLPLEIAIVESSSQPPSEARSNVTPQTLEIKNEMAEPIKEEIAAPKVPENNPSPVVDEVIQPKGAPDDDVITAEVMLLKDKWTFILETIKPYNYSLEALLRQAKIVSSDDGVVVLEVPYSFHQRILQAPKSRNLLESVLSDVLGKASRVNTILGKRPVRVEELANVELAADDEIIQIAAEIFNS